MDKGDAPTRYALGGNVLQRAAWIRRLPWSIVALALALMILGCLGIARSEDFGRDHAAGFWRGKCSGRWFA